MKKSIIWIITIILTLIISGLYAMYTLDILPFLNKQKFSYNDTALQNRVFVIGDTLTGNETVPVLNDKFIYEDKKINIASVANFNTKTVGKKTATVNYNGKKIDQDYYVVKSTWDKSLNGITSLNNFYQTYYIGEKINLDDVTISFYEIVDGYMTYTEVPVTKKMVSGFRTLTTGIKTMTISYKGYKYKVKYFVKNRNTSTITSDNFQVGYTVLEDTVESTEHFEIHIAAGTYIAGDYKKYAEEVYDAMCDATGLSATKKINIVVDNDNFPSCAGNTIYIDAHNMFMVSSSAFAHELAHAVVDTQPAYITTNIGVYCEGFASYVEYLTTKKLYETNSKTYAYSGSFSSVLTNIDHLKKELYKYNFENEILGLKRDELVGNSQYETGARFFSYIHSKYGDFTGFLNNPGVNIKTLEEFKIYFKNYYGTDVFSDFYNYEQSLGDKFQVITSSQENLKYSHQTPPNYDPTYNDICWPEADLSSLNTYNFFFNMELIKSSRGSLGITYKDLYIGVDSARHQLSSRGIEYEDITLKTKYKDATIELYAANGLLLKTITNSTEEFSLSGVSFIKLVGAGANHICFNY